MSEPLLGGCLCGAVRYRLIEEPFAFYACHCTDCQRQTGSAFGLSMFVRSEAIETLRGEPRAYRVTLEDGRMKCGRFCGECSVRLWGEPAKYPDLRVLRPGTLDRPGAYAPFGDIWTASRRPWVALTGGPVFERQPEDALALVKAWQRRPRA
jgi:hypothetical protein